MAVSRAASRAGRAGGGTPASSRSIQPSPIPGTNSARIQHGQNALYFSHPLSPGQAYELRFAYRLAGESPSGQVALGFFKEGGRFRSAGAQSFKFAPPPGSGAAGVDRVPARSFCPRPSPPPASSRSRAGDGSTLWIDDVSLRAVPRPADLAEPTLPWEGLKRRTPKPLFKELLTTKPGGYTVISWAHDLNPRSKTGPQVPRAGGRRRVAEGSRRRSSRKPAKPGMGFMDLPGRLDGKEPWRTAEFHREQFRKYGVRYDVFSENSASTAAGLKNGAELLNATAKDQGRKPVRFLG